ncbi:hypothetical protein LguiB_013153 [Lonicera macranthoides]
MDHLENFELVHTLGEPNIRSDFTLSRAGSSCSNKGMLHHGRSHTEARGSMHEDLSPAHFA